MLIRCGSVHILADLIFFPFLSNRQPSQVYSYNNLTRKLYNDLHFVTNFDIISDFPHCLFTTVRCIKSILYDSRHLNFIIANRRIIVKKKK